MMVRWAWCRGSVSPTPQVLLVRHPSAWGCWGQHQGRAQTSAQESFQPEGAFPAWPPWGPSCQTPSHVTRSPSSPLSGSMSSFHTSTTGCAQSWPVPCKGWRPGAGAGMGSQGTSPPVINYPPSLLTPSPPDIIQSLGKKNQCFSSPCTI